MLVRVALWVQAMLLLNAITNLDSSRPWGSTQLFPAQLIPEDALTPRRSVVRRKIVLYHNFFRTKVRPTATNMLLMSWHAEAARQAQNYAEKCIFLKHNALHENVVPRLGICGQNLFVAAQKTPWFFAIKEWFREYKNFTYGSPYFNLKEIGHYTQMVWATTHKVGCGIAHCRGGPWGHFYNYVCHYCPGGNFDGIIHYPYKAGKSCDDCPNDCLQGTLCTNPCPHRDHYSNCVDLVSQTTDACRQGVCNATCSCGAKKIYKNYPWK